MTNGPNANLEAFREEARAWLIENFPPSLVKAPENRRESSHGISDTSEDGLKWKECVTKKGWGVPTWPQAFGGGGLSPAEARIVQQEMDRIGAENPIQGFGVMMLGPTLLEYGDEAQKARHLPPIASGEQRWCQGFSEPGAGSDLASLKTKCEDKGDYWLVNGQKIWTSGAQEADWCFCLVRTDASKKHDGISFLLIDMASPGVEVRPIQLISGNSPFCETFFNDVRVPKENLVGPLNEGWVIGKRLLQHERNSLSRKGGRGTRVPGVGSVEALAKIYVGTDEEGRIADSDLRLRLTTHLMDARAFALTLLRAAADAKGDAGPSATTSIMKNAGTKIGQERAELIVEILGHQGLGWDGKGFSTEELELVRAGLRDKATTIYGGSQEIQNNIISKRILGLPDPSIGTSC